MLSPKLSGKHDYEQFNHTSTPLGMTGEVSRH